MPTPATPLPPEEIDGAPRLPVLDILRGVAILAILFVNIDGMGGSLFAEFDGDVRRLGWTPIDQVAWWLRQLLVAGTARGLLEMLFGVGMVILIDRAAGRLGGTAVFRDYAARNLVLLGFGLVHVFVLLWPGDILHTYALAALVVVPFRAARPRLQLTLGLSFAALVLVGGLSTTWSEQQVRQRMAGLQQQPALTDAEVREVTTLREADTSRRQAATALSARIATEDRARTSNALDWVAAAWRYFLYIQRQYLEMFMVWEAAGGMLIGAALYRWGVIQGARGRRFYLRLTVTAYAAGLTCRIWMAAVQTRFDGAPSYAQATSEVARLATTIGHVGLVNLLLLGGGARLLRPFAAAGRTALSIYVLQSILCLWLIYPPWGLALYGRQGRGELMLTAMAVDAGLLLLALWWMRRYRIAPVEWAWRSLAAWRRLPFRRADQRLASSR